MARHRRSKPRQCIGRCALQRPGAMNPVIPGYFADPTVKKFGDTYYMYATTDGSGAGFRTCPAMVEQGFRKLDPDAHELARQPLDMGSRCYAQQERRQVLLCLLPAVPDTCRLRRNPARPVAQHPRRARRCLSPTDSSPTPSPLTDRHLSMTTARYTCIGAHGEYMTVSDAAQASSPRHEGIYRNPPHPQHRGDRLL